jgi:hypothetical protein
MKWLTFNQFVYTFIIGAFHGSQIKVRRFPIQMFTCKQTIEPLKKELNLFLKMHIFKSITLLIIFWHFKNQILVYYIKNGTILSQKKNGHKRTNLKSPPPYYVIYYI